MWIGKTDRTMTLAMARKAKLISRPTQTAEPSPLAVRNLPRDRQHAAAHRLFRRAAGDTLDLGLDVKTLVHVDGQERGLAARDVADPPQYRIDRDGVGVVRVVRLA